MVDVSHIMYSKKRKVLSGVALEVDRLDYHFFDAERRELQELIDRKLPGYQNQLISHNHEETRWVLYSGSDRSMGTYYLLDSDKMELTKLFELTPWLDEKLMAETTPIEYRSRDGLRIRGYLTLPREADPQGLPLVVNPHGGPWARDSWGFDPEVQFLASRGYAVLQMNFRGSTGFGRRFMEASFG